MSEMPTTSGAVLVGEDGRLQDADTLVASTLYASGEPCAMCAGAFFGVA